MTPTVKEQPANGTVIQEQPAALTPDQRLAAFQVEIAALMEKYGVQLVPYRITFNDGTQMADAKFMLIQK